jgi:hypothetical protein
MGADKNTALPPCVRCHAPEGVHELTKEDWRLGEPPRCPKQGLLSFLFPRRYKAAPSRIVS